jgi:hypothetical protein
MTALLVPMLSSGPCAADAVAMTEPLSIGFKRRLAGVFAAVFALLAVTGTIQAISSHEAVRLVVALVVFGGAAAVFAAHALHRAPVLVLDHEGLTDLRGGVVVRWQDVRAVHVAERRDSVDRCHDLVLTVDGGHRHSLSVDHLTTRWRELARLVEARVGSQVTVRRESAFATAS